MVKRKRGHKLERWEVAMIKALLATRKYNDQDVLAYFTRPTRSINHRAVGEVRTEAKHKAIKAASAEQLQAFLQTWPDVQPETGLSLRGDELLIKAREAMIAAVHTFNSAGLTFRSEIFITTAMIAWTYLVHAWFKREGVDFRYRDKNGALRTLKSGADALWDLSQCIRHPKLPLENGARLNLELLIEIRHEIEHRSTNRIDDALGAKLQACCLNFNEAIRAWFGTAHGLERRLPLALQFVTFDAAQRANLKKAEILPAAIASTLDAFHARLNDEELADPAFAYRVAFVPKVGSKASKADLAVEFVNADSLEAEAISQVLLKDVDKKRYTPSQVVKMMRDEGFAHFKQSDHTNLWKALNAREDASFGRAGDYVGTWVWFVAWVARVRAHCQEKGDLYK